MHIPAGDFHDRDIHLILLDLVSGSECVRNFVCEAYRAGPAFLNSQAVFDKWTACWFKLLSAKAAMS